MPAVLLIGPRGHGGEEVYVKTLLANPPAQFTYTDAGGFHEGAPGAPCRVADELLFNRLLHRHLLLSLGLRALKVGRRYDLVHAHAHPVRIQGPRTLPIVLSEGSSTAVYLREYLGWNDAMLERQCRRARRVYRWLGIADTLVNLDRASSSYVFSNWARDVNLRWGADPAKLKVVYPGFPTPRAQERQVCDEFVFLFVGTDFERKGGFEVVAAFALLAPEFPQAKLCIVSSDPLKPNPDRSIHSWVPKAKQAEVMKLMTDLERQGRIERHLLTSQERLFREFYPRASAFVMPSWAEGFGFTNVEAASHGLPVISSRIGAIVEAVHDGKTGILVAPGEVIALAEAMRRLVRDPEAALAMGRAARADFLERFTMARFRTNVGQIYAEALR